MKVRIFKGIIVGQDRVSVIWSGCPLDRQLNITQSESCKSFSPRLIKCVFPFGLPQSPSRKEKEKKKGEEDFNMCGYEKGLSPIYYENNASRVMADLREYSWTKLDVARRVLLSSGWGGSTRGWHKKKKERMQAHGLGTCCIFSIVYVVLVVDMRWRLEWRPGNVMVKLIVILFKKKNICSAYAYTIN